MYKKTGTSTKMTASNTVFAVSDQTHPDTRCALLSRGPAVSKAGIVFDVVETRIDIAELFADTLDESSYVGTITLRAVSGDEVLAVDEIINLPVADVLLGLFGYTGNNLEFRQSEIDRLAGPQRPVHVEAQLQRAEAHRYCLSRFGIERRAYALRDQLEALQENWQPAGFVDEIDRTPRQRGLFVDVVGQHGQKDHRDRDPGAPHTEQHLHRCGVGHAPDGERD